MSTTTPEQEALETVLDLIYEIVGAPKDAPYGDLPGYVREALTGRPEIPEGWVLVPREPTREMLSACMGNPLILAASDEHIARQAYRAMLAATPTVEESK